MFRYQKKVRVLKGENYTFSTLKEKLCLYNIFLISVFSVFSIMIPFNKCFMH